MDYINRLQKSSLERKNRRIDYIGLGLVLALKIELICSFLKETLRYRNLVFFDAIVMLLFGAMAQLALFLFLAIRVRPETWKEEKMKARKQQLGFNVSK